MDAIEKLNAALSERYSIERELGAGGMATVYLAEDLKHHRPVALKVLHAQLAAVLGPERFLREIDVAARLTHPHILPLHDSGSAAGTLYYVMPYVEGESLRDRLAREKQLALDDALQIAREVADALSYAHSRGVVHRDIKPENILLESGHAVVADFGIARAIGQAGGTQLTETGVTLGTPAYMSPEQAAGSHDLDGRSDLYSLGCVLYEMLAGQPPFTGPTVESVVHQHLAAEPPSITGFRPAVPASVAAALQRALAKTPADRFNPVALFAEAIAGRAPAISMPGSISEVPRVPHRRPRRTSVLVGLSLLAAFAAATVLALHFRRAPASTRHPRTAIAVLPLENLSAQGPYAYFAGGLHDELLTQLAKLSALTVIGRTSVRTYAGTTKRLREIADELGVGSIVEASVQVEGNRLRVIVQLIDPETEAHVWAETYDRRLDDAFSIQSDIAQRIAAAVGATLTSADVGSISTAPTQNGAAYQLYLQGNEYMHRAGYLRTNFEAAQRLYERAVALDSSFALAHAALSKVHGYMSWWRYDPSPARLARQRAEAEIALRQAPSLAEAHAAMGEMYYRGELDYRRALDEFRVALRTAPNNADLWYSLAAVYRRLGMWDSVFVAAGNVLRLDPRNANLFSDLDALSCDFLRRYAEAIRAYRQAILLAPDEEVDLRGGIAAVYVRWTGHLDTLRAYWQSLGAADRVKYLRYLIMLRQPDTLLAVLEGTGTIVVDGQSEYSPRALYAGWAQLLRGDTNAAGADFDSARVVLDSVVRTLPGDWRVHMAYGRALAGSGRFRDALREARWLEQSATYRRDRYSGATLAYGRAQILAEAGSMEAALGEIQRLLAGPSFISLHTLQVDPSWDPIRKDPRFQAILAMHSGDRSQ